MIINSIIDKNNLANDIKRWGKDLGFQEIGFTNIDLSKAEKNLKKWLDLKFHGEMHYMEKHGLKRSRPDLLIPNTISVISARMNYLTVDKKSTESLLDHPEKAYISRYALGRDYHKVLRQRLKRLGEKIEASVNEFGFRVFVDSAPVLEKPLAEKAGLGWIGKNTNLIDKNTGSWFFLGELYTDLDLPISLSSKEHCGTCRECIDICPTQAIVAPYVLDARRCISYLTIELKGSIPLEYRKLIGNRIYGCDDCLAVCPWNKFAKSSEEIQYSTANINQMNLGELSRLSDSEFRILYAGSPIKRIGRDRFVRNVLYAIGNSQFTNFRHDVKNLVDDPDFGVSDAAKWALKRLDSNHGK